jgi:glycosyltransferase involved in cell wall biosynthesis
MQGNQDHPTISVVIPTYNEAQNLPHVLPYIPAIVSEISLVDGHSNDDTVAVAQQLLPNIRVIQQKGKGKGDALRTAFAACTGDIIVTLDADGSSDPMEIPRFVDALGWGYDFAKGSRFLTGADSSDISFIRRLGNKALCSLVNLLFGMRFTDLCYGYNAFWRWCLDEIAIESGGFEIETEMILSMHKARLKIVEVPSHEHRRVYGESKLHALGDGLGVLMTILRMWMICVLSLIKLNQGVIILQPPAAQVGEVIERRKCKHIGSALQSVAARIDTSAEEQELQLIGSPNCIEQTELNSVTALEDVKSESVAPQLIVGDQQQWLI